MAKSEHFQLGNCGFSGTAMGCCGQGIQAFSTHRNSDEGFGL